MLGIERHLGDANVLSVEDDQEGVVAGKFEDRVLPALSSDLQVPVVPADNDRAGYLVRAILDVDLRMSRLESLGEVAVLAVVVLRDDGPIGIVTGGSVGSGFARPVEAAFGVGDEGRTGAGTARIGSNAAGVVGDRNQAVLWLLCGTAKGRGGARAEEEGGGGQDERSLHRGWRFLE